MGRTITCTMDNSVLLVVSRLSSCSSSISLSSPSRSKDQYNYSRKSGTHHQIQCRLEVTSMHVGNRCWQIVTIRPRWTVIQRTRWTSKIQCKAFLFGYSLSQLIWRTWRCMCSHIPLRERELRFGRWCFKSGDTKNGSIVFHGLLAKKPKEIYSGSRKVWWFDNSRAQSPQRRTWISEQSPIRCRGTSSPHSRGIRLVSLKRRLPTRRRGRLSKFLEPSHRPKVVKTDNSMEFGKACEDLTWKHRTSTPHRSERNGIAERAVRRVEEGTSALLLRTRIEWKVVVWLYGMLLPSARCQRPPGRSENSVWKTIWRTIPRADDTFWSNYHPVSPRDQARIHQFVKNILSGIFLAFELVAGRKFEKEIFW